MVNVCVTSARISVRVPVAPELPNASLAELIAPLPTVNVVAVPIAAPEEFRNEIVPAHDAAVPLAEADAVLTTLTCAVSELASPAGGKAKVRVLVDVVVVVCANAANAAAVRPRTIILLRCIG
jgi:hypothetical protein